MQIYIYVLRLPNKDLYYWFMTFMSPWHHYLAWCCMLVRPWKSSGYERHLKDWDVKWTRLQCRGYMAGNLKALYCGEKPWSLRHIRHWGGCWCCGVRERCVTVGGLQVHAIEEAHHLTWDLCQDTLSKHFLRRLERRGRDRGTRLTWWIVCTDLDRNSRGWNVGIKHEAATVT